MRGLLCRPAHCCPCSLPHCCPCSLPHCCPCSLPHCCPPRRLRERTWATVRERTWATVRERTWATVREPTEEPTHDQRPRHLLVGRLSLRLSHRVRGRALVALQVRQVRLDHTVFAALREPIVAPGRPYVPLRHPVRPRWSHHGSGRAERVDRARRHLGRRLSPHGCQRRCGGGDLHRGGNGDPDLPPSDGRACVLGDHPHGQDDVCLSRDGHRAWTGQHRDRQHLRALRLPRGRLRLVPWHLPILAAPRADGGCTHRVQAARSGCLLTVRAVAVHPAGARLQRPGGLPHPPLHRLPQS